MKKLSVYLLISVLFLACTENEKHFLSDENYREIVQNQFEKRKRQAENRHEALFSVFDNNNLSLEQKEALQFLYAYMPLCDLADYDSDFFLKQIDAAFVARDFFSWGKTVPEDVFRHFVLVHRVNNEYLDTARTVFFEELKERIKDLSMYDAVLEVNHWCHEKVTYRGTDARTSAPLALVKTSWGRCGEESTFTSTALRAVGIPARQVYTPRWVHTDSNHAWVEVWIDGKWYYLGACEPDYELNRAWFDAPAQRAMMMHTNVFGYYTGVEEKTLEKPLYSIINLLSNYADTRTVNVCVQDIDGNPVSDAKVQFKVYNYSELYPIATTQTNAEGKTSIVSGLGDIMIWANKGEYFGYKKSTPQDENLIVVLKHNAVGDIANEEYVMNVPAEKSAKTPDEEKLTANANRLACEDSIRNAYMNTFADENFAKKLATDYGLNKSETWKYISLAQGNWEEIAAFIKKHHEKSELFPFLASLTEKDLRDTPEEILTNHIDHEKPKTLDCKQSDWVQYVLSPRIDTEIIKAWRSYFQMQFNDDDKNRFCENTQLLVDYVKDKITIDDSENYYNCRITPQGVHELCISDLRSLNIYFVALCRSFGIPARIEKATNKTQYLKNNIWTDVSFQAQSQDINVEKGKLQMNNHNGNIVKPAYGSHYTIAKYSDGDFQTLNLRNSAATSNFPYVLDLDKGFYRLMLGSRANDGSVFVNTQYFEIKPSETTSIEIKLPIVEGKLFVKGIIDMNSIVELSDSKTSLKELANGKGAMLCFVDIGKEPSIHILQDLPKVSDALDNWNGGVLMIIPENKTNATFNADVFKNLPKQTVWAIDKDNALFNAAIGALQLQWKDNFPLTLYLTNNGGIIYSSEGYRIGIGENILRTIEEEKNSLK